MADPTCAELEDQLAEARTALHKLMLGGVPQRVRFGEKEVAYARNRADDLQAYVNRLANQVAACRGISPRKAFGIIPV